MELPPTIRSLQIPLLYFTNILSLSFKPSLLRTGITLPIYALLLSQSLYQEEHVYYGVKYPMGCLALTLTFIYIDWIILASPDKERWHRIAIRKKKIVRKNSWDSHREVSTSEEKTATPDVPKTFTGRFIWAFRLSTMMRHVNWSQQVKNVPELLDNDYPRWLFFIRRIPRVLIMYLVTDISSAYTAATPHGSYRGFENGKVPIGFGNESLGRQFFLTWVYIINTYGSLEMINVIVGIAAVALGLSTPADCPSAFGDLKGMYTVRKSWSVVWHQNCRRICSTPSLFLVRDVLGLRKGSFASKYLQLFLGFFISAVVHGGAAMLCHHSFADDNAFAVFIAQAVAIMIEDHVIELGQGIGLKDSKFWRAIGYVWVVAWFGLSVAPYVSANVDHGIWIHEKTRDVFKVGPQF